MFGKKTFYATALIVRFARLSKTDTFDVQQRSASESEAVTRGNFDKPSRKKVAYRFERNKTAACYQRKELRKMICNEFENKLPPRSVFIASALSRVPWNNPFIKPNHPSTSLKHGPSVRIFRKRVSWMSSIKPTARWRRRDYLSRKGI